MMRNWRLNGSLNLSKIQRGRFTRVEMPWSAVGVFDSEGRAQMLLLECFVKRPALVYSWCSTYALALMLAIWIFALLSRLSLALTPSISFSFSNAMPTALEATFRRPNYAQLSYTSSLSVSISGVIFLIVGLRVWFASAVFLNGFISFDFLLL